MYRRALALQCTRARDPAGIHDRLHSQAITNQARSNSDGNKQKTTAVNSDITIFLRLFARVTSQTVNKRDSLNLKTRGIVHSFTLYAAECVESTPPPSDSQSVTAFRLAFVASASAAEGG